MFNMTSTHYSQSNQWINYIEVNWSAFEKIKLQSIVFLGEGSALLLIHFIVKGHEKIRVFGPYYGDKKED